MILLTMFLSFMGVYELIKMYNNKHKISNGYKITLPIITSIISGVISIAFYKNLELLLYVALPLLVCTVIFILIAGMFDKSINMTDVMVMFGYMIYGGLSFALLSGLRFISEIGQSDTWKLSVTDNFDINLLGFTLIGYALIVSSTTDMGGIFGGLLFGKHKLCPSISPKKTIEGALAGLLVGALCGTVVLCTCEFIGDFRVLGINEWYINIPLVFIMSMVLSFFGQVGDLVASKIKREHDIKDYGNIFPGHGGVLDRFDSAIFTCLILFSIVLIISICTGGSLW